MTQRRTGVPKDTTQLFQVRISEEEKRRIKTLAASQGMTLHQALTAAFAAWADALKAGGGATGSREPKAPELKRAGKKKPAPAE